MKKKLFLIFAALYIVGCNRFNESKSLDSRKPKLVDKIEKFSTCEEIKNYLQSFSPSTMPSNALPIEALPAADSAIYDNQVNKVKEGDILQMNSKFFFFVRKGGIEIIDRSSLKNHKSLQLDSLQEQWLLYQNNKLIYIAGDSSTTFVKVFDESKDFQSVFEDNIKGKFVDFRMIEDKFVFVSQLWQFDPIQFSDSSCSQIYRANLENGSFKVTFVNTLEFKKPSIQLQSIGFLGDVDYIYMTKKELFLFKNSSGFTPDYLSHFRVVDWKTESPSLRQVQTFDGYLKDRWSISQKNNSLLIAVTFIDKKESVINNKIIVYDPDKENNYQHIAESPSFGLREDIRSILYLNNKAYVVTFEKTDPLFILDIKDPKNIQILSQLQSPGFSTQLREIKEDQLGGLGFQTLSDNGFSWFQGLKFSLFDVQNPLFPLEVDKLLWGDRGSYSEATFETKALFVSSEVGRILFPIVIVKKEEDSSGWNVGTELQFAGAMILEIQDNKIKEVGRVSHKEWRESICGTNQSFLPNGWWNSKNISNDIQRAFQIGNKIYTFSRFGIKVYNALNLREENSLEFSNTPELCRSSNIIQF